MRSLLYGVLLINSVVLEGTCLSKMHVFVNKVVKYYVSDIENCYIKKMIRVYGIVIFS